jgi:hypothetical protein
VAHSYSFPGQLDHEDGGVMIVRNVENYVPNDTVSHARRCECSATPLGATAGLASTVLVEWTSWAAARNVYLDGGVTTALINRWRQERRISCGDR